MIGSAQISGRQKKAAFTLIEILVVMAILALLAALLFPILASVREQGRKTTCVSNLHQLYFAFALYAENEDRYLPPYDTRVSGADSSSGMQLHPVRDEAGKLVACLWPYTRSQEIWFCPSDGFARTASTYCDVRHQFLSYDYTTPFLPYYDSAPRRIDMPVVRTAYPAHITEPAGLPLLIDSAKEDYGSNGPYYSHNGRFNILYLDGHIQAMTHEASPYLL